MKEVEKLTIINPGYHARVGIGNDGILWNPIAIQMTCEWRTDEVNVVYMFIH